MAARVVVAVGNVVGVAVIKTYLVIVFDNGLLDLFIIAPLHLVVIDVLYIP